MRPVNGRPSRGGAQGSRWRALVAMTIRRHGATCWICGHPGATEADHVIALSERPDLAVDLDNLRPAHGTYSPCPVCSPAAEARGYRPVRCNPVRQAMSVERARRIIGARTGLPMPGDPGFGAASQAEGREW